MSLKSDLRNGLALPTLQLPGQRRLTGGKNLDGSIWIEVEGQGRISLPPDKAMEMAFGILKACGVEFEDARAPAPPMQ